MGLQLHFARFSAQWAAILGIWVNCEIWDEAHVLQYARVIVVQTSSKYKRWTSGGLAIPAASDVLDTASVGQYP